MSTTSILLLVATLQIGSISKSKEDKRLTEGLERTTGAKKHQVKAQKALFKDAVAPISSIERQARAVHGRLTFQGLGDDRLVAPGERATHEAQLTAIRRRWQTAVDKFIANYDEHLKKEAVLKGTAFKLSDYPIKANAAAAFRFQFGYLPMGDPQQFLRIFADQAQAEQLRAQYQQQITAAVANVTRTQFNEVLQLVREVSEVLSDPDAPIIDSQTRKGPLTYLREYVQRLPLTNIQNDPEVERLRRQINSTLDVSTKLLRESSLMRQETAAKAREIVDSFTNIGRRRFAA